MIYYKVNDTLPPLIVSLQVEAGFDLSGGKTCSFVLYKPDGTLVTRASIIADPVASVVQHDWQAGDLDQLGSYAGEFIVADGSLQRTFPSKDYIQITVVARPA